MISRPGRHWLAMIGVAASALPIAAAEAQTALLSPPIITRFAGRPAPPLAARDRAGRPVTLAGTQGKVVIVNLWATWCGPCRAEMPSLERLAARYPGQVVVIAVANDDGGWPAVDRFWGNRFPHVRAVLASGPELGEALGVLGLPYSLVLDRHGRELARVPKAAAWDQGQAKALIAQAVAAR